LRTIQQRCRKSIAVATADVTMRRCVGTLPAKRCVPPLRVMWGADVGVSAARPDEVLVTLGLLGLL